MCKEESTIYMHYLSTYKRCKKKKQLMDLFWMVTVAQCRVHEVSKREVEWIGLAVRSRCSPFGCNNSCVQLFWRVAALESNSEGKSPSWPAPCDTATRLTCHVSAAQQGSLAKMSTFLLLFLLWKKQISVCFLKSSREKGRGVSGAYIQLKKTQMSPVNTSTSMSDRDQWFVFMPACVSQSARAASSASSWEHL